MYDEVFSPSSYQGTKGFKQQDVATANATGFGAASDDYAERGIDLNEQLIMNKPATFFFRMNSDAMTGANIFSGDVLVVDRSLKTSSGKIVVAAVDGELIVRRYEKSFNKAKLLPENDKYGTVDIGEFTVFLLWGVVTCVIHLMEPCLDAFRKNETVG